MFGVLMLAAMVGMGLAIATPCALIVRRAGFSGVATAATFALVLLINLSPLLMVALLKHEMLRSYGAFIQLIPTITIIGGLWAFAFIGWPILKK